MDTVVHHTLHILDQHLDRNCNTRVQQSSRLDSDSSFHWQRVNLQAYLYLSSYVDVDFDCPIADTQHPKLS